MDRTNIPLADMRQAAEADLMTRLGVNQSRKAPVSSSAVETVIDERGREEPHRLDPVSFNNTRLRYPS
jgi:hypothetical protein